MKKKYYNQIKTYKKLGSMCKCWDGWRTPRGLGPLNINMSWFKLMCLKQHAQGLPGSAPGSLHRCWLPVYCVYGIPACTCVGLWFMCLPLGSFPSVALSYPNLKWHLLLCLITFYLVIFLNNKPINENIAMSSLLPSGGGKAGLSNWAALSVSTIPDKASCSEKNMWFLLFVS